MQINLVAVGDKMPSWIRQGFLEYQKRLPAEFSLNLIEVAPEKYRKNLSANAVKIQEGIRIKKILKRLKSPNIIAMQVNAKPWSTETLSQEIKTWQNSGQDVSLLVGGAEGLSEEFRKLANSERALSKMTFPHYLVRVIIAEQLYRAWSFLQGHPYHRP